MKFGKTWGETEPLLVTPFIEVHRINIEPYMKCSEHCHNHKWNAFYLVSGVLKIHVIKNNYNLTDVTLLKPGDFTTDVTLLKPGDFTTVKPGEYHWFESVNDHVEALEIYYPQEISEDIVRRTVGGPAANMSEQTELMGV